MNPLMILVAGPYRSGTGDDPVKIQANVANLSDEDYISTVGSGGASKSDRAGTAMTLLPGAPRQGYLTIKKRF